MEATQEETLPQGSATVAEPEKPQAPEAVEAEAAAPDIKIGDRTFKTQEEAFSFAQSELARREREVELADAYRAGVSDAGQLPVAPQQVQQQSQEDPEWEQKFYSDPKKTLKEYGERIREEVKSELRSEYRHSSEEDKLWSRFYERHPDLEGFDEDVKLMLNKYTEELKVISRTKGKEAGFDYLAQKTKAKFQAYMEAQKPSRELPNTKAGPSTGTQTSVTPKIKASEPIDMITQIRNLRKQKLGIR